jgi:hypothetical protein
MFVVEEEEEELCGEEDDELDEICRAIWRVREEILGLVGNTGG